MKKTNNFNNMVDELFKSFLGDDVQFTTSCTERDKENCHFDCEPCKDNDLKDKSTSTKQVFEWTDDDFTSEEAVVEYCNQLDTLVSKFKKVDSWLNVSKLFGFDFVEYVEQLKDHAWSVYDEYVEDNTHESLDEDLEETDEPESNTTQNLAERYVNEVIKPTFYEGLGLKLEGKTAENLVKSYKEFADWVLDQH